MTLEQVKAGMATKTQEPVAIEAMDLEQLRARLGSIRTEIAEAPQTAAGDTLQDKLLAERKKVNARIAGLADEAESESRDKAILVMNEDLGKAFDFKADQPLIRGITVSGVYRKSDTGWDDLIVGVGFEGNLDLLEAFHNAFPLDAIEDLASVRGVSFQINRDGAKVEYVGRAPGKKTGTATAGGGGRGHKWSLDGGPAMSLDEAFRASATPAEITEHDAIDSKPDVKSPNSAKWTLKRKVVTAAKYVSAALVG